jgi:haloacetate dehalogenase
MAWFQGFEDRSVVVDGVRLRLRSGGRAGAPPLLLLHGFPQTGAMWQRVAQTLAPHFQLLLPDMRGYGASDAPPSDAEHGPYSKRAVAAELHALMLQWGHERYFVAAHDRGARVAHRLALDQPQAVQRLALLDIVPTLDMYDRTDMRFARAYYHWFFLIQPAPHPESMIDHDPLHYLHWKLGGWGSGGCDFYEPQAMAEYENAIRRPEIVHAMCEDYRASAGIDLAHDRAARAAGERIACPLHLLWGERGVIQALFDPWALWHAQCAGPVSGQALPAGHFLAEECPEATAAHLLDFFSR